MFPIETKAEKPSPHGGRLEQGQPESPVCDENAIGPGGERSRAEGRVEAEARDGNAVFNLESPASKALYNDGVPILLLPPLTPI